MKERSIENVSRWISFVGLRSLGEMLSKLTEIALFTAICDAEADNVGVVISADEDTARRLQTWFQDGDSRVPFLLVTDPEVLEDKDADLYFFHFPEGSASPVFYVLGKDAGEVNRAARRIRKEAAQEGAAEV